MILALSLLMLAPFVIIAAWLYETRKPPKRTTEQTWWLVVARHVDEATPGGFVW